MNYDQDELYKLLSQKYGMPDNMSVDPSMVPSPSPVRAPAVEAPVAPPEAASGPSALGRALSLGFSGLGDAITNSYGNGGGKFLSTTQDIFKNADDRALKQKENQTARDVKRAELLMNLADKRTAREDKILQAKKELEQKADLAKESLQAKRDIASIVGGNRKENEDFRKDIQRERQDLRQKSFNDKQKEELNNRTERLGKDLASFSEPALILNNLEKEELGFPLDSVDYAKLKEGKVVAGGKEKDLPGVNLPLVGRVSAYSGDARALDQTMQKLLNVQIKDRAGTAVSSNELERIKKEYGQGKLNTEADLVRAMIDYKKGLAQLYKTQQAKYDDETKNTYKDRGGPQYDDVFTMPQGGKSSSPKLAPHGQIVMQNGKTYAWDGNQYVEAK